MATFIIPDKWDVFASESGEGCCDEGKAGNVHSVVAADSEYCAHLFDCSEFLWPVCYAGDLGRVNTDAILIDSYAQEVHLGLHED